MSHETTIPVLPCVSLPETLAFYALLGFEVTYKQTAPYLYLALRRGGAQIHFHGGEGIDPDKAFSTCLWMVPEVEGLYREFADALKAARGKLPIRGVPRITRFRAGQTRFTVVDPSGNSLVVIRHDEDDRKGERKDGQEGPISRLGRALRRAARLRDFKNDDRFAADVLDQALARPGDESPPFDRARVLVARAELAVALADPETARRALAEVAALPLSADERQRLQGELQALAEFERSQS